MISVCSQSHIVGRRNIVRIYLSSLFIGTRPSSGSAEASPFAAHQNIQLKSASFGHWLNRRARKRLLP